VKRIATGGKYIYVSKSNNLFYNKLTRTFNNKRPFVIIKLKSGKPKA